MGDDSRKSTLLLVEDEAIIAMAEKDILCNAGYSVLVAHSGEAALNLVRQGIDLDLVLMDIDLGEGDDGTAAARSLLELRELPVVFLTNHGEREIVAKVKDVTRYGYVIKDSGEFVLLETIERALDLFRAHCEVRNAESRFRHIISDFDGAAVQGYAVDGTTIFWNAASEKLYGYTAEEALGQKLWDLIIPEQAREEVIAAVRRMGETGVPQPPEELKLRRKDGAPVHVYSSHSVSHRTDGGRELYCIDIDLSERNQAQERLKHINQVFSALGTDPEENMRTIVTETCTLLGGACSLYNKLDANQESLCTWAGSNLPPDFQSIDTPEGHICYEATMRNQDKPVIISELRGTEFEKSDANVAKYGLRSYLGYPVQVAGRTIGALCVVDTKPRHFSETDLHIIGTLAKGLEMAEERKSAKERITELISEKELLLKEIQHRFKNDMALLKSMLSIQASRSKTPETEEALLEAEHRIAVLGRIYDRLTPVDGARQTDLMSLVHEVVKDLRSGIVPPGIGVEVEGQTVVVPTKTAVSAVILLNELVTNAVKYAFGTPPEGNVRIWLAPTDSGDIAITVTDTGAGFTPEVLQGTGYGFGLTVVQALVTQHRGSLELSNDPGATARVLLRRDKEY